MLLESIHINNYRGLKNFKIDDFKTINLLVGKNSCGKTSIIESIFLLIGGKNPSLPIAVQNTRYMVINNDNDFKYLFNNFDIHNNIEINADTASGKMKLIIEPKSTAPIMNHPIKHNLENNIMETAQRNDLKGLGYHYTDTTNKEFHIDYSFLSNRVPINSDVIELNGLYLNTSNMMFMWQSVSELINNKAEKEIIEILKVIDSRITGIKMGANNTVYVDVENIPELVPINIMGDGISRIVSILAGIVRIKNGILLIDEIENGLYPTSLKILWKAIFTACKLYNVQVFATTHSYECIAAFSDAYKDINDSSISLIRLNNDNGQHSSTMYSGENLENAIKNEIEVR